MHQRSERLDDAGLAQLVGRVRASAARMTAAAFDELASELSEPVESVSLRGWPQEFPADIAVLRQPPYEAQADSVMYRQILASAARERDWDVRFYDAKTVEAEAARILGDQAHELLHGPRRALGTPWTKDHRMALAATVMAGNSGPPDRLT